MPVPDLTEIARTMPGGWYLHGQVRLELSGANLLLRPYKGNYLIVDNAPRLINDPGITLAPDGLVRGALFYIYCGMTTGTPPVPFLTASPVGHVTTPGLGVEVRADNPRQTLVGMVYVLSTGGFADAPTQQMLVASWFNRRVRAGGMGGSATTASLVSASPVELLSATRVELVTGAEEAVQYRVDGAMANDTASKNVIISPAVDGDETGQPDARLANNANTAGLSAPYSCGNTLLLSEGYHYLTTKGSVPVGGTGTVTWWLRGWITG